ncbi:MAG: (d)CMP kinase [Micrococcaceae bacterium]
MTDHQLAPLDNVIAQHHIQSPKDAFYVAIDGRSGSGKSTLAQHLATKYQMAIFHLEDLYQGWDGLDAGIETYLTKILPTLNTGKILQYLGWDWHNNIAQTQTFTPQQFMIFEGVGSCDHRALKFLNYSIWIECGEKERKARALARDGETFAPHWNQWAKQEQEWLSAHNPRTEVDLVIKGGSKFYD